MEDNIEDSYGDIKLEIKSVIPLSSDPVTIDHGKFMVQKMP